MMESLVTNAKEHQSISPNVVNIGGNLIRCPSESEAKNASGPGSSRRTTPRLSITVFDDNIDIVSKTDPLILKDSPDSSSCNLFHIPFYNKGDISGTDRKFSANSDSSVG